jgi:HK97 gp10 family phage protein
VSDGWGEMIAGLNTLAVDLSMSGARAGARAALVVRKTTADIERDAQAFAPVDTGNLRNSIGHDITGDGRSGAIESEIGPTADYGAYVEFGTSQHGPAAYMGPAFDRHTADFEKALGQIADDTLGG